MRVCCCRGWIWGLGLFLARGRALQRVHRSRRGTERKTKVMNRKEGSALSPNPAPSPVKKEAAGGGRPEDRGCRSIFT